MTQLSASDYTPALRSLMQRRGVSSFRALSQLSGVSAQRIRQLRHGQIDQLQVAQLQQLSAALQISADELMATFSSQPSGAAALQAEYERLQAQLAEQKAANWEAFQRSALQTLEPWLLQFPTAAHAAQQNPQLPAVRLLPLMRPIEQLLQDWGVEAIAPVGSEVPFDPQLHQLMEGAAQPGDTVRVRYAGYRQGDRLLHRAKVSPVATG